ncbi:hypothetical protein QQ045_001770 [Rhodiola kirilowii]
MSLRYGSRVAYQLGVRAMQVVKDRAAFKTLFDTSSGNKARRFTGSVDYSSHAIVMQKRKQEEKESLRTVMFLSCWGPN